MEVLVLWLACGIIAAMIGARKGEGCLAFIAGILLGPVGIIGAVFSRGNRVECRFCRELIHRDATACPHCQREIKPPKPTGTMPCPLCKEYIPVGVGACPHCAGAIDWRISDRRQS